MNWNDTTRQAVILGALLHDIGKFAQRAQEKPKRQNHSQWGREWFQENLAEKLTVFDESQKQTISSAINNHYNSELYISIADAISAGMDRINIDLDREEKGDPFNDRLISIFSRVSISDKPKKDTYYKLAPLSKDGLLECFPADDKKCKTDEYSDLLTAFNKEIKTLNFTDLTPQQVIEKIYFLLWKYTWCIPSAVYKDESDVSLFDHLKTTAAIAGCLYDYQQEHPDEILNMETPAFYLIGGDISGIQEYIFNLLTESGRVARRLRARSFLVQVISEIAVHQIIHKFNLPLCNVISSAGGNFYLLVPNTQTAEEELKQLQTDFDKWTYEHFQSEIFLSLGWVETSGKNLGSFHILLDKLKSVLHARKYRPYHSLLVVDKHWQEDKFVFDEVVKSDESICSSCRHHPVRKEREDVEEQLCERCHNDTVLGRELPKAKYIAFFRDNGRQFKLLNYSFELWDSLINNSCSYLVVALNDPSYPGVGFKYIANHIPAFEDINCTNPQHEHQVNHPVFLDFDRIADTSKGDSLLGYVKGDVDNMGEIFRWGFDSPKPEEKCKIAKMKPSISRFCSLSRMIETFFAGYLQARMTDTFEGKEKYWDMYTVFSGGDDFFVVGPWNRAIDFVKEIRSEFSSFTGNNPDFTFSAGIVFAKPHEPIAFCAESAIELLEQKSKKRKDKLGEIIIKDGVTLFEQTVSWKKLNHVMKEAHRIIEWLTKEQPVIVRAFVYRLYQYGEMARKSGICGDSREIYTKYLKFVPLLTYDINRNLTKKEQQDVFDWVEALKPNTDLKVGENLPYLKTITEYVLTYTRGGV